MFGPSGQMITEDYPADHPHHRGVWWSWPVTRWGDQLADIWAVVRVHAPPSGDEEASRLAAGPVMAVKLKPKAAGNGRIPRPSCVKTS